MGNNTLMFKVGIADIKTELDKHKREIESWVNSNPIKLKVQLEDSSLEQLATKLKAMGATFGESNAEVKKLQEELAALKAILNSMMNGAGTKESPITNELRVMTKSTETAMTAMNQLSKLIDETTANSAKRFPILDRVPAKYSQLIYDIENRMTQIGKIMSQGNLPSWLDDKHGRGYINNVLSDYERLLKTMQHFQKEGFIDFHNVIAFRDVFRGLESAYGPIMKQADEYNKKVEKQAQDVAKYEQQKVESIRKAEEKGEKERAAARAKEEKDYEKVWQNGMKMRENAAKAEEKAIDNTLKAEERAGAARVAARDKIERDYEKVWQKGLNEREKAAENTAKKEAQIDEKLAKQHADLMAKREKQERDYEQIWLKGLRDREQREAKAAEKSAQTREKAAQAEKKSADDAIVQYNRLEGVIYRLVQLRDTAASVKVDTTWVDSMIGRMRVLQEAYEAIYAGKGKTANGVMFGDVKNNPVTLSYMQELGLVFSDTNKQISANLKLIREREKEHEREIKAAEKAAALQQKFEAARQKMYSDMGLRQNDPGLQNITQAMDAILPKLAKVREDIDQLKASINSGSKEGIPFINENIQLLQSQAEALMRQYVALAEARDRLSAGGNERSLLSTEKQNKELEMLNEAYRKGVSEIQKKAKAEDEAQKASDRSAHKQEKAQERIQNAAKRTAESLGSLTDKFDAKKLNFKGADFTELDIAIGKIRAIKQELENFARTGTSSYGNTAKDIVHNMGLAGANEEARIALNNLTTGKREAERANKELSDSEQRLANAIKGTSDSMRGQSQILSDLKMMAMQYLSVWGAQSFVNSIIETGGLLEQQRLSLSAILGDMGKATTLFEQIKTMALKSPFGVVELDKMSKQLSAYSFEYEELFDWTKRLADISAATGTSVDRLALALGHVRSEGALSGYTLRQFAMANVPVLRMLSENLGISSKEVRERVKKKEISAEDVQDILKQLTEDGGMFANAQETMSEALNAKFKNLRDAFDIMYGEIAESGVGDELKNLAVMLTNGAKHWERLTKDILMLAAAFGTIKIAMYLYNSALGKETAATLRSAFAAKEREVANLKLTKSYRALTIEEEAELNMQRKWWSFGSKLNSRNLMVLLSTKKLTVAQLERAVAMGKVSKADAIAAMNLLKLNTAQMQSVKVLGFWGRIWQTIANGARMAGLAVKSFLASVAPLLALTAVFELWNRRSEQEEEAKTMSTTMAGVGPGREAFDLRGSLTSSNKLSEEALKSNIEEMKNALEAAGAYTDELKKQVDQIEDTAKKYDLLKTKIGEVADKYEEMKASQEKMLNDAWDAGGGWFTDNMATDAKDYDAAFAEYTKALTVGSKQIKNTLRKWMEIQGLWKAEFSELTGKQLLEQLSEQDANRFLANGDTSVYRGRGYDKTIREALEKIAEAKQKVGEQLEEMKGDQGKEFAETLKAMYEEAFNIDLDKLEGEEGEKQKIAFDKWLRETIGRAEGLTKEAKEALRNIVIGFTIKLVPQYVVEEPQTPQEVIDQQIGNNKWLSGFFGRQNSKNTTDVWTVETAKKEVKKYQKLFGDISLSNLDTAPKKLNSLLDGLEETKKNLQNTLDNGLLSNDEQDAIQKQFNEATQSIDLANKALKDVGGKRERKGGKSGKKNPDTERAKAVREQVRVIKEAADAFQYWRDKVGDKSAWEHVQSEFGDVLKKIGITADNIEDVRSHLKNIPLMKEYQAITDQKIKTEIDKEIAKDNDQYIRKDFEKDTEKWASALTRDLDELTRKWEIFNSVVSDTGDRILATRLSGISPGTTPAALKRSAVASFAGARIDFDSVLLKSDEEIDRYVESLGVAEEKIKAVQNGLKDWKKTQEELIKSDIQNYAKWLGSLVDLESIRMHNQEEYNRILEETNRLLAQGIITQEEAEKRRNAAATNEETKNWQATTLYSSLYNNSRAMAEGAFYEAYNREMASLNDQLKAGILNMNDYADKVGKLNKIAAEFRMDGFLGIKGGAGAYLSGGYQGLIDYHRNRAAEMRKNNDEEGARQEEETAESMEKAQKAAEQLTKVFQDLSNGANLVANLFDALGMEGAANAFGDAAGVLGGAASGAQSLSALGPWGMAVGGAIGGLTSIFQLSDKAHERRIQELKREVTKIDNTLNTIKSLRERELGYDSGSLRRQMAAMYKSAYYSSSNDEPNSTIRGMREYYGRYSGGNGYSQEYNALIETRKKYMEMYDEEYEKKKSSSEALEEYKTKIAELDEQIMFFTQDLANELWGIDIQGWADQISDSLWTAFENGEDALEAFHKTAKEIISDVAKRMMTLSLIEPAFKRLQNALFGEYDMNTNTYKGGAIKYDSNGNIMMQESEEDVLKVLGQFFGEGGEMEKNVEAAEMLYKWVEKITGFDLSSDESKSGASSSIKNITESTADLLAAYLNAVRASVSKIEFMDAEYYPKYLQLITSCNLALTNIQTRAKEIADSNAAIERNTRTMADLMNGLKNKTWKLPVA